MEDTRNLIDYYKYWDHDAIVADMEIRKHNFSILCANIGYDFNIATIIRNCNAFNGQEVIIYGRKKIDRRGCVGTYNYLKFRHVRETDNLNLLFSEFDSVIGIDNVKNASSIEKYIWEKNKKTLICFGQEDIGLPENILNRCDKVLYIKQYGSVRSMNVGSASAIVMYDYCSKIK